MLRRILTRIFSAELIDAELALANVNAAIDEYEREVKRLEEDLNRDY